MADYNFTGLNSRDFEHLTQALAISVISKGITPFGDGPDGAREATFNGTMQYPSPAAPWHGYLVIQSKFRARPSDDASDDGTWVLKQLKSDLSKFENTKRNLQKPQYYILVTNVVLTPKQDTGSKDKVFRLLEEYKTRIGLQDFDVWDYDKLCRLLDTQDAIRNAYAAFISSGDIIAKMMEILKHQQPDFFKIISRFLENEMRADQFVKLEQAGHHAEHKTSLAQVFVDLPVSDRPVDDTPRIERELDKLSHGVVDEILTAGSQVLKRSSVFGTDIHVSNQTLNQTAGMGRYVIVGGPGQGKSTIGQFICQLYRAAILRGRPPHTLSQEALTTLVSFSKQCDTDQVKLPIARRFPVRVVLDQFATDLANNKVRSLLGYILERVNHRIDTKCTLDDLRQWLAAYPWLIVLDGLDEVPATSNRQQMLEKITDFWGEVASSDADVLVVATTRPQGYNEEFSPRFYQHRFLVPLSQRRALHYADRLAEAQYGNNPDQKDKVLKRLRMACEQDTTRRLMRSPLQVTIMATLVDRIGQPPQERWRLFQQYYEVIYQRETEREISASRILQQRKADVNAIHHRVGLLLQAESEQAGTTESRLPADRFYQLVRARIAEEGHEGEQLICRAKEITEAAVNRLVFLVGLQENKIGFEIRSLQEFMAAEALMDGREDQVRARLEAIAPIIHWRNVFLFAAGKCFAERQFLRDMIVAICEQLNDPENDKIAGITLAGSRLALDILADGSTREQPKYARSLARIAVRLLDVQDVHTCQRLGSIYEPVFGQLFREQLVQRLDQQHFAKKRGAWALLVNLIGQHVDWAIELANVHWPDDVRPQRDILVTMEGPINNEWAVERLVDYVPKAKLSSRHPPSWRFSRDMNPPTDVPEWFHEALTLVSGMQGFNSGTRMQSFALLPDQGGTVKLSITPIRQQGQLERAASLATLPFKEAEWAPYISAARFMEQPSHESLARELRWLSQVWDNADNPTNNFDFHWPLAACLSACRSNDDLIELADRAENGQLGSSDDWLEAESRWQDNGVRQQDLQYMSDVHWPFDNSINKVGFPIACSDVTSNAEEHAKQIAWLLSVYNSQSASKLKSRLAFLLLNLMREYSFLTHVKIQSLTPRLIRQLITDAEVKWKFTFISDNIPIPRELDEEWVDLFEYIGNIGLFFYSRSRINTLASQLSAAYIENPRRHGLLKVLSRLFGGIPKYRIPDKLLAPSRFNSDELKRAALEVRLAQGKWDDAEASRLARLTTKLMMDSDRVHSPLMTTTRFHRNKGDVERYALALRTELMTNPASDLSVVMDMLDTVMRSRTSQLNRKGVWLDLGLPSIV